MNGLKQILDFYISSSIHVALSVFSFTWITLILFDVAFDENVLFFNFFASITGYNFVKYFGLAKFHHRSLTKRLKVVQVFSLICFLLMCFYTLQLQMKTILFIAGFGVITFLYAIPFLPKRFFMDSNQNLRNIGGLKVYVIGMVWSGVTVFLPLLNTNFDINTDVVITAVQRFLFIVVLMMPFEIRDLQYDSLKLSTIPQKIGVRQTKLLGIVALSLFFFLDFFKNEMKSNLVIAHFAITFLTLLLLVFAKENQGKYYSAFWVEAIPIFWLLLIMIL
ncbi:MAG: hypothetical protein R2812_11145 [Gelidibacter sp.]